MLFRRLDSEVPLHLKSMNYVMGTSSVKTQEGVRRNSSRSKVHANIRSTICGKVVELRIENDGLSTTATTDLVGLRSDSQPEIELVKLCWIFNALFRDYSNNSRRNDN